MFGVPTVNIGPRQDGRTPAANIIDVPAEPAAIAGAITRALSPGFRASLRGMTNPYGDGRAGDVISSVLTQVPIDATLLHKKFADLPTASTPA